MTDPTPMDPSEPMKAAAPEPTALDAPAAAPPQAAPPSAGSTSAMVYGDVPNRIIAYIIDIIVVAIISVAVGLVLAIVGIGVLSGTGVNATTNWFGTLIVTAVGLAISG